MQHTLIFFTYILVVRWEQGITGENPCPLELSDQYEEIDNKEVNTQHGGWKSMLEGQAKKERGCASLNSLLRESLATETFESKPKVKKKTTEGFSKDWPIKKTNLFWFLI